MSEKSRHKKDNYTALIIGAGRIAALFDTPKSAEVLTHAHAFTLHPKTTLVGFVDVQASRGVAAAKKWGGEYFDDVERAMKETQPDIVSICTPDDTHTDMLNRVLSFAPPFVICEKPVTLCVSDTEMLARAYAEKNIPVLVNYSRRFDTRMQQLRDDIRAGAYGKVLNASGIYTKGLLHSGSHMIDFARFLFGEVITQSPLYTREDYLPKDVSVAAFLTFERCPQFHLAVGDTRAYDVFECDIFFEKGRVRIIHGGRFIQEFHREEDTLYKGFFGLGAAEKEPTKNDRACYEMVQNAVAHLDQGVPLLCDMEDALKTQRVCEALAQSNINTNRV